MSFGKLYLGHKNVINKYDSIKGMKSIRNVRFFFSFKKAVILTECNVEIKRKKNPPDHFMILAGI